MLAVFRFGVLGRAVAGRINERNDQIPVRGLLAKKSEMKRTSVKGWTEQIKKQASRKDVLQEQEYAVKTIKQEKERD